MSWMMQWRRPQAEDYATERSNKPERVAADRAAIDAYLSQGGKVTVCEAVPYGH